MKTNIYFRSYVGSFLLRMEKIPDKSYRETQNTHLVFSNFFFFENRAVYEIMWGKKNSITGRAT